LAAILVAAALVLFIAGPDTGEARGHAVQDNRGGITVKATYITAGYLKATPRDPLSGKVDPASTIVIALALDTHSGDLMAYDPVKRVILRTDRGQQLEPLRWVSTADGAHHRAGALVFARTDRAGRPVEQSAGSLELIVRDLGGVAERILRWTLPVE
jgi:hypothetical protein